MFEFGSLDINISPTVWLFCIFKFRGAAAGERCDQCWVKFFCVCVYVLTVLLAVQPCTRNFNARTLFLPKTCFSNMKKYYRRIVIDSVKFSSQKIAIHQTSPWTILGDLAGPKMALLALFFNLRRIRICLVKRSDASVWWFTTYKFINHSSSSVLCCRFVDMFLYLSFCCSACVWHCPETHPLCQAHFHYVRGAKPVPDMMWCGVWCSSDQETCLSLIDRLIEAFGYSGVGVS